MAADYTVSLADERTAVRLCPGLQDPCGHLEGVVKRNKRGVLGLTLSFIKHTFMYVFLLVSNTYLLSTYYIAQALY